MGGRDLSAGYLTETWRKIDWRAAEKKLSGLQRELTISAKEKDWKRVEELQDKITSDLDIRCLAVNHIASSHSGPGVDKVRWRNDSDKMLAAFDLNPADYRARPYRQIILETNHNGKQRRAALPTYFDRAMSRLYVFALAPVTEALADRGSFAFRQGRSTQDALDYVKLCLQDKDAPQIAVIADIKSYYARIQHDWILEHVPLDKHVLEEFLTSGIVFAGGLFENNGRGISEGSNISPYIGNFALDGLERYLAFGLHRGKDPDWRHGFMVRFADDIMVAVRTLTEADKVIRMLNHFLAKRGVVLSPSKTHIRNVNEGFDFLSQHFQKREGILDVAPSRESVARMSGECREIIYDRRLSPRKIIEKLNRKLSGFATYHKFSDAREAFKEIDEAIQAALLDTVGERYANKTTKELIGRYWTCRKPKTHYFSVPQDRSQYVIHLQDIPLAIHRPLDLTKNPYEHPEYFEKRNHARAIHNISGDYAKLWRRQNGRCLYCGQPILIDQDKEVVRIDESLPAKKGNQAYIHALCSDSTFEFYRIPDDVDYMKPYEVIEVLRKIDDGLYAQGRERKRPKRWKYQKLEEFFFKQESPTVKLTFTEVEEIIGAPLPAGARKNSATWDGFSRAWKDQGYERDRLDIANETVVWKRSAAHLVPLNIPKVFLTRKIPENAKFELEQYFDAVIREYGL